MPKTDFRWLFGPQPQPKINFKGPIMPIYTHIYPCISFMYPYIPLYIHMYPHISIWTHIYPYIPIYTHIWVCETIRNQLIESLIPYDSCVALFEYEKDMKDYIAWCLSIQKGAANCSFSRPGPDTGPAD